MHVPWTHGLLVASTISVTRATVSVVSVVSAMCLVTTMWRVKRVIESSVQCMSTVTGSTHVQRGACGAYEVCSHRQKGHEHVPRTAKRKRAPRISSLKLRAVNYTIAVTIDRSEGGSTRSLASAMRRERRIGLHPDAGESELLLCRL